MRNLLLLAATLLTFIFPSPRLLGEEAPETSTDQANSLVERFHAWHKALASDKKKEREDGLQSMLPSQKDIEYLFPEHSKQLWPIFEKNNRFLLGNAEKFGQGMTRGGPIKGVRPTDVRKDEREATGPYKRILAMIPKGVPVFDLVVEREGRSSGNGSYLYVNDHWIWIKDLESLPDALDQMK